MSEYVVERKPWFLRIEPGEVVFRHDKSTVTEALGLPEDWILSHPFPDVLTWDSYPPNVGVWLTYSLAPHLTGYLMIPNNPSLDVLVMSLYLATSAAAILEQNSTSFSDTLEEERIEVHPFTPDDIPIVPDIRLLSEGFFGKGVPLSRLIAQSLRAGGLKGVVSLGIYSILDVVAGSALKYVSGEK